MIVVNGTSSSFGINGIKIGSIVLKYLFRLMTTLFSEIANDSARVPGPPLATSFAALNSEWEQLYIHYITHY